jgi:hypothetical protein
MVETVRVYRVTGARRAVCGLASGAMLELECEAPLPPALWGASSLRPMEARVVAWCATARVAALVVCDPS